MGRLRPRRNREPVQRGSVGRVFHRQKQVGRRAKVDEIKIRYGLVKIFANVKSISADLIKLYKLRPSLGTSEKATSHREILRNRLRKTVLNSFVVRTPKEDDCMLLANASAEMDFVLSGYEPNRIPLPEAERLFKATIKALEINVRYAPNFRLSQKRKLELLRQDLKQIKKEMRASPKGNMKIDEHEFKAVLMASDNRIKELMKEKGVSEEAKLAFEAIDQVVKEYFKATGKSEMQ